MTKPKRITSDEVRHILEDVVASSSPLSWRYVIETYLKQNDEEIDQLRVQLAGCLAAAEGATKDVATEGMYGWSLAYQKTLELRLKYETFFDVLKSVPGLLT
jgi:hypothetical protein